MMLFPGQVQNLRLTRSADRCSVVLTWDEPKDVKHTGEVTVYDIRFRPSGSKDFCHATTVNAPATSVTLTRESGLNSRVPYCFEVRARSTNWEGQWQSVSDYAGTCIFTLDSLQSLLQQFTLARITLL